MCYFFFDSQLTGLIQNEKNTAISKHFTKPADYTRTTTESIFGADAWINGGQVSFCYKTLCIAFASFIFFSNKISFSSIDYMVTDTIKRIPFVIFQIQNLQRQIIK